MKINSLSIIRINDGYSQRCSRSTPKTKMTVVSPPCPSLFRQYMVPLAIHRRARDVTTYCISLIGGRMPIPRSTQQHFRNANVVFFYDGDDDDDDPRTRGDQLCPRLINMPSTRYALSVVSVLSCSVASGVGGAPVLLFNFQSKRCSSYSSLFTSLCHRRCIYILGCNWLCVVANNCNI